MIRPVDRSPSLMPNPAVELARKALNQQKQDGQTAISLIYGAAVQPPPGIPPANLPLANDGRGALVSVYA